MQKKIEREKTDDLFTKILETAMNLVDHPIKNETIISNGPDIKMITNHMTETIIDKDLLNGDLKTSSINPTIENLDMRIKSHDLMILDEMDLSPDLKNRSRELKN